MEDGAVSPPPPIVEEKKPKETTEPTQETRATDSTQAIPDIPPVITTSGTGGKKPVSKKMIATILGVLVLVGGIGAGVILVQNQQDIREKAAVDDGGGGGGNACISAGGACYSSASCSRLNRTTVNGGNGCNTLAGEICCSKTIISDPKSTPNPTAEPTARPTPEPPNACDRSAPDVAPTAPDGYNNYCNDREIGASCYNRSDQEGTCQEIGNSSLGGTQVECKCEVGSTPVIPDPADPADPADPISAGECYNVKAFDTEWNSITTLSSLVAGDVIRFTVSGNTNSGSFSKARFTINGTLRSEVSAKRPSTEEFYDEYTIPEGVTTFTINAEIYHSSLGWF